MINYRKYELIERIYHELLNAVRKAYNSSSDICYSVSVRKDGSINCYRHDALSFLKSTANERLVITLSGYGISTEPTETDEEKEEKIENDVDSYFELINIDDIMSF